jgi:hypothetical protein
MLIVNRELDELIYTGRRRAIECWKFAEDVIDTNIKKYKKRNQKDRKRIMKQICIGKVAEWGAYQHLRDSGIEVSKPDMKIYPTKGKSFDADLSTPLFEIHVKTQTIEHMEKYGASWIFQNTDPLLAEPTESDLIALTHVNYKEMSKVLIVGYVSATAVNKDFTLPDVYVMRRSKLVLRKRDIGVLK